MTYPYRYKVTKCRQPILCSICHHLIKKGEMQRAFYNRRSKEWAQHYPACKKEEFQCASSAEVQEAVNQVLHPPHK